MAQQLAARGGRPVRSQPFPEPVVWDDREIKEVTEVLRSGQCGGGIGAAKNAQLGELMARLHDVRYCVPVSSGTAALEVALLALGVRPGDEVIVPAYTWIATPLAALSVGAIAVFADVDRKTFNLDPADVERKITPRTQAIVPVHWGGRTADEHLKENPVGHNYRLTDLQAAVLLAQLSRLDELADRRQRNADHLDRELARIDGLAVRPADERITRSAYYLYLFRYDPAGF